MTEKNKVPFKDTMAGPTVVLLLICLVISGLLAITYQVTAPQIEKINKENADAARMEVLSEADAFTAVEGDLPDGVVEYYVANNGAGAVATAENKSFGGTISVMVGFDQDGAISGVKIMSHADTPGVGTKAMEPDYLQQYVGLTETENAGNIKNDTTVDQITGATVSSNGIYGAVNYAIAAYAELGGTM